MPSRAVFGPCRPVVARPEPMARARDRACVEARPGLDWTLVPCHQWVQVTPT